MLVKCLRLIVISLFWGCFLLPSIQANPPSSQTEARVPDDFFVTESSVMTVYGTEHAVGGLFIIPGFGESFLSYEKNIETLNNHRIYVAVLQPRSRDGVGIHLDDFEASIQRFYAYHVHNRFSILSHSLSVVWPLRYMQESSRAEEYIRSLIALSPVLQSPVFRQESFNANTTRREAIMRVHVRLGSGDRSIDLAVSETAGYMRDLMRAIAEARRKLPQTKEIPIRAFFDERDPILRGRNNEAVKYFHELRNLGYPIGVEIDKIARSGNAHNFVHESEFFKRFVPGGPLYRLISNAAPTSSNFKDNTLLCAGALGQIISKMRRPRFGSLRPQVGYEERFLSGTGASNLYFEFSN